MNDILTLLSFPCGVLLGGIFYGGLWLTVQLGINSKYAALWFFTSFILRLAIAVTGFYFISNKSLVNILFCLGGFMIARTLINKITKPSSVKGGEQ